MRIIAAVILIHAISAALAVAAFAHQSPDGMHYDPECCSSMDCAPVQTVTLNPDGSRTITNKNGHTARFGASFPVRPATDGKFHACISPHTGKPICIYANPGM